MARMVSKKYFLSFFALVVVFSAQAADFEGMIEFSGGGLIHKNTDAPFGSHVDGELDAWKIGFSAVFFWGRIGFGEYFDIYFPTSLRRHGDNYELVLNQADCSYLFGIENLIGFSIKLIDGKLIKVPLTVGFHFQTTSIERKDFDVSESESFLGLGLNLTFEVHIVSNFFLFARVQASYDFNAEYRGRTSSIETDFSESGFINKWGVTPSLGIGFNF